MKQLLAICLFITGCHWTCGPKNSNPPCPPKNISWWTDSSYAYYDTPEGWKCMTEKQYCSKYKCNEAYDPHDSRVW